MTDIDQHLHDLVTANHILARENVVDAFGHISIRHPQNPQQYILSQSRAPQLVTPQDLMEYTLDGHPIDQQNRPMYAERPIHGAIYQTRPNAHAVIHNHSPAVLPFTITPTPLRPIFHLAAIIGESLPLWDIRQNFGDTTLLVTTMQQGRDLAAALGPRPAALMRGHGCVIAAPSLKEAVMTAIYLQTNAQLLLAALPLGPITYLSPGEIAQMAQSQIRPTSLNRAWEYWTARAARP